MTMQKFKFAIIAKGIDPEADNFEDRFSEAGCDDATISVIKRPIAIDFTREGKKFAHAVASAVRDVEAAGASVVLIEHDTCAT